VGTSLRGAHAISLLEIDGPGPTPPALVNAKGVFTLKGILVNCAGLGPDCAVKTKVTGTVPGGSAAKTVKLGGSSFVVKAGKTGKVKPKLTKKGLKLLKRLRKIKAKAAITVTRGAKTSKKTVKVTLKAPKRKR
jgi:hypothetical protein